ncbi:MAG: hypothetical protein R2824_07635 [Saprospiraceae bacterium]|nr:hypothetical protein [Lewinella sp.]
MERSKSIVEKIKAENIKPIPKWYFRTRNLFFLLAFSLSILLGAAAFSVILFSIQQTDFNLIAHLSHSRFELLLGLLPYFWLFALLLFLGVAVFSIQRSEKGYKFTPLRIGSFSIGASILLGTLFFISGGGPWLENIFVENIPLVETIQEKKAKMWMQPEAGLLSGTIDRMDDQTLRLIDFSGGKWEVTYEGAFIAPVLDLQAGEQIKIVGSLTKKDSFHADEIRPWGGPLNIPGNGRGKK